MIKNDTVVFVTNLDQPLVRERAVGVDGRTLGATGICKGKCNEAWTDWYIIRHSSTTAIYHESELEVIDPMATFDAFNIGDKVIMTMVLPEKEVGNRVGSVQNRRFMENRTVGAFGEILAVFPKRNIMYVGVDGLSTLMFSDEVAPYSGDALADIMNPQTTDWVSIDKWLTGVK